MEKREVYILRGPDGEDWGTIYDGEVTLSGSYLKHIVDKISSRLEDKKKYRGDWHLAIDCRWDEISSNGCRLEADRRRVSIYIPYGVDGPKFLDTEETK